MIPMQRPPKRPRKMLQIEIKALTKSDYISGYKFGQIVDVYKNSVGDYETSDGYVFYSNQVKEVFKSEVINENTDSIVESVLSRFKQRSEAGIKKYNTTLERNDLNTLQWLTHLQEELMDATLYIERLKQEYDRD